MMIIVKKIILKIMEWTKKYIDKFEKKLENNSKKENKDNFDKNAEKVLNSVDNFYNYIKDNKNLKKKILTLL